MTELNVDTALDELLNGVVPERMGEVRAIIKDYQATFRDLQDRPGFSLEAGPFGSVQFTPRSIRQIWLFGYGGMYALHSYAIVFLLQSAPISLRDLGNLSGQSEADEKFSELLAHIDNYQNVETEADFCWPSTLPDPTGGRPTDIEMAAAYDLTCIATAFVFLHELKHVVFVIEGNAPKDPRDEEHACDEFAQSMMLDQLEKYCEKSGEPVEKVRMKRAMGIGLAKAFIFFATPNCLLGGSESHPGVGERIRRLANSVKLGSDDYFWLYLSCLSLAIAKNKGLDVPELDTSSFQNLTMQLIECIGGT